jgi:hypothetical protein
MCQCGRAQCGFYRFSDYCMVMLEKDTLMICAVFRPLEAAAVLFRACSF